MTRARIRGASGSRIDKCQFVEFPLGYLLAAESQEPRMKTILARLAGHALAVPLRLMPFIIQQTTLEQGLNRMFRGPIADGELDFLEGRTVVLEISDFGWRWPITLRDGRICVQRRVCRPDTVVRGGAAAFIAVAGGVADPDTLFFQRRLSVEGDTELGLALKNFLDGLDPARLPLQFVVYAAAAVRRRAARGFLGART
jgi:predicted lipid carrier protein YhbT